MSQLADEIVRLIASIDRMRTIAGFMGVADVARLGEPGVTVLDPFSTMVSRRAVLQPGVVLWPGATVQAGDAGHIVVGLRTQLFPMTRIVAEAGRIVIGDDVEIGEAGGFTIRAETPESRIEIGDGARLTGGGSLSLDNAIGRGGQILGAIHAQNCRLGNGGTYREPNPDCRGGVLKGSGVARHLDVPVGMVIQAFGLFAEAPLRPQSYFHPK